MIYDSILTPQETEHAIKFIKDTFQLHLSNALHLRRVTAPLFVKSDIGLNDNLSGIEKPVSFTMEHYGINCEIVHSLAKWKRMKLYETNEQPNYGIYTDMNAIRKDEILDNIHSIYVDQWDWEKVIDDEQRNIDFLYHTIDLIYHALLDTEYAVCERYPKLKPFLPPTFKFITAEELVRLYPHLTPKEREKEICKKWGVVFICGIGGMLSNGTKHDHRAPDYDDWSTPVQVMSDELGEMIYNYGLNGDLLVWYEPLDIPIELSSMGLRVNEVSLRTQLEISNCEDYTQYTYHQMVLHNQLPQTIGGGIGQSRLCMILLHKKHIGEVQSSIWDNDTLNTCKNNQIHILQ